MYYDNAHVRVNLSGLAQKIVSQDMVIFGSDSKWKTNGFINLLINRFLTNNQEFAFFKLDCSLKEKGLSLMIRPSEENRKALKSLFEASSYGHEIPEWYSPFRSDLTPSSLFKTIIETYARLPMIEREFVVLKDTFDFINKGLREKRSIRISISGTTSKKLDIVPYKVVPAKDGPYSYLIGLQLPDEGQKKYVIKALRISRIICESYLSHKDLPKETVLRDVDASLAEFGPTFLEEKPIDIKVCFLNDEGIAKYQYSIIHRPIHTKIENDSEGRPRIYTFHCSEKQAIYFFFRLVGYVQIVAPEELKNKFVKMYRAGYEAMLYGNPSEEESY